MCHCRAEFEEAGPNILRSTGVLVERTLVRVCVRSVRVRACAAPGAGQRRRESSIKGASGAGAISGAQRCARASPLGLSSAAGACAAWRAACGSRCAAGRKWRGKRTPWLLRWLIRVGSYCRWIELDGESGHDELDLNRYCTGTSSYRSLLGSYGMSASCDNHAADACTTCQPS